VNRNISTAATDWQASLDELTAVCPNLESVRWSFAWFGTDLRAGNCRVVRASRRTRETARAVPGLFLGYRAQPLIWSAATREARPMAARLTTRACSRRSADLKSRGLKVYLYLS